MESSGKKPVLIPAVLLVLAITLQTQTPPDKAAARDDPDARPPVTKADVRIVQRAREILSSPAKWNRADNRVCPAAAKTFSLYCALEKATDDVSGHFEHRGAAMQEAHRQKADGTGAAGQKIVPFRPVTRI